MNDQFSFQNDMGDIPPIVSASEPHMALLFLLDTSGSMGSSKTDLSGSIVRPIDALNDALNSFKQEACKDEHTKEILDVAIIEFNNNYRVVQEFTPVEYMDTVQLQAGGQTYMSDALDTAINMIDERSHFYRSMGTEPYKPWIVLISDGAPFDSIDALAAKINAKVNANQLAFWSLSVPGANNDVLHKLSGQRVLNLHGYDFKGFIDWTVKSMRAVSVSSPGEKPKGQALPSSISIDDLM